MILLVFCLLSVTITRCAGDLLITDLPKNKHFLVNEDMTLQWSIGIKSNEPVDIVKARKTEEQVVIYRLHTKEIKTFKMSNDSIFSEGKIALADAMLELTTFDVQPSGDFLVISDGEKIYLYNPADSKMTEVLKLDQHSSDVLIHPTKRIIYYPTCDGQSFLVFVYDVESKSKTQFQVPYCLNKISIDHEGNIIWGSDGRNILTLNLNNKGVEAISSLKDNHHFAISSSNLFFMNLETKKIHKFIKKPKPKKQLALQDFKIEPVLSHMKAKTPVLFNIEKGFIELFDENFAKTGKTINLEIEKKAIKSIRSTMDEGSTTFYWIHDSNEGVVQFAKVNHNDNKVIARNRFQFETIEADTSKEIVDFDIEGISFYLAIGKNIFKANIDSSNLKQNIKPYSRELGASLNAVAIHQRLKKIIISCCGKNDFKLMEFPLNFQTSEIRPDILACSEKILLNEEAHSWILSTSAGLYTMNRDHLYEQIYNDKIVGSFLSDKDYVYFVSKADGPGIYKINIRRSVEINHELQLERNSITTITNVKELAKEGNDKEGDGTKDKGNSAPNSMASFTSSPEEMLLALLINFVVQILL